VDLPLNDTQIAKLKAGDEVTLSGKIYTARDAAHKRLVESIQKNEDLPLQLKDQIIFYAGPTPHPTDNNKLGSIGPTTSYRMDSFTPDILNTGVKGLIGKGKRADFVNRSLLDHKALYFIAIGGIAALLAKHITKSKIIAYADLGTEAIRELTIINFPVIVATDIHGGDIFKGSDL